MKRPVLPALKMPALPVAVLTSSLLASYLLAIAPAWAQSISVPMFLATPAGRGKAIGHVTISATPKGTAFKADLSGLPPGPHGFHVNENDMCGPILIMGVPVPAGAAGYVLDPERAEGKESKVPEGLLPNLTADADGKTTQTVVSSRVMSFKLLQKRSLVIDVKNDASKARLDRGDGRLACGVIE